MRVLVMAVVGIFVGVYGGSNAIALSQVYVATTTVDARALLEQFEARLREAPEKRGAGYGLARLRCFIYAYGRTRFAVTPSHEDGALPYISGTSIPLRSASIRLPVSPERITHLVEAIRLLRQITDSTSDHAAAQLFYGYACREAAARCQEPGWPTDQLPAPDGTADSDSGRWEEQALNAFRAARALRPPDPKQESIHWDYQPPEYYGSLLLYRMLSEIETPSAAEKAELKEVEHEARQTMSALHGPFEGSYGPVEQNYISADAMKQAEALYPRVPDAENGAVYFLHALDAYIGFKFPQDAPMPFTDWREGRPGEFNTFTVDTLRVMEEYLESNGESIRLLREAAKFERCAFPFHIIPASGVSVESVAGLRDLSELLGVWVAQASHQNDPHGAVEGVVALAACARAVQSVPSITSVLMGTTIISQTSDAAQWAVERLAFSEDALLDMQKTFAAIERTDTLRLAQEGTRLGVVSLSGEIDGREMAVQRKITDINDPGNAHIEVSDTEIKAEEEKARKEIAAYQQTQYSALDKYTDQLDLPLHDLYDVVSAFGESSQGPPRREDLQSYDPMGRVILAHIGALTQVRVTQTTLAAARFQKQNNQFPQEISQLVPSYLPQTALADPFSGGALQTQVSGKRYTVYSVGYPRLNQRVVNGNSSAPSGISFTVAW